MPEIRKYTVVDLFAGVGGLSYGFSRNEHYEIILANEMQKDIAKAYTLNHPSVNMLQGDIKDLSENVLRQAIGNRTVDVVVGGPPCQSYSTLGKRQMDARANLFMEYKRVLRILHPRAFLFENVKGILSMDKGALFVQVARLSLASTIWLPSVQRSLLCGATKTITPPAKFLHGRPDALSLYVPIASRNLSLASAT